MFPVRNPVVPTPIRGVVSERSEDQSLTELNPLLVRAIREPWLRPVPPPVETQPLSQVVALCNEALALDAMRPRDAAR